MHTARPNMSLFLGPAAGGPPPTNEAETTALLARMSGVPAGRDVVINDLIVALKANGAWTLADYIYVPAAHSSAAGALNWKAATATLVATASFHEVDRGIYNTNAGGNNYWTANIAVNTLTNAQQNSATFGAYGLNLQVASNQGALISSGSSARPEVVIYKPITNTVRCEARAYDNTTLTADDADSSTHGMAWAARSGSGAKAGQANDQELTASTASAARPTTDLFFLSGGGGSGRTSQHTRAAFLWIGGFLTKTQRDGVEAGVRTYLTALGAI